MTIVASVTTMLGDKPYERLPPGRVGRLQQILPLGDELPQLVAPLATRKLADLLELVVVGAGDGH